MKKKFVVLVMALAMVFAFGLTGCGSSDESGDAAGADGIKIAYLGPHQNNEYQIALREAVEAAAADNGVECKVYIADNDPAKQVSQIEQAINEGVQGIVMDPCSFEGIAQGITAAKEAGVPLVTVHEVVSNQDEAVAFAASDLRTGGKLKMEQVMEDFPDGAQLAVLYGPLGHAAQIDITEGYKDALKGQEDKYPYVFDGEGNWAAEDALDLVSNWLATGKKIDAIVCNNDGMAIGALQAVKAAGMDPSEILIYGLDAQQDVLTEVKAGNIRATIFNDYPQEASKGVELCLAAIAGETVDAENLIDPKVVTIDNVDEYLK